MKPRVGNMKFGRNVLTSHGNLYEEFTISDTGVRDASPSEVFYLFTYCSQNWLRRGTCC